jgi:hypothetical protein
MFSNLKVLKRETSGQSPVEQLTSKPYFADVVAAEPSQVVKDTQLVEAATYGDTDRVAQLLQIGAKANTANNGPLKLAAANGHAESVKLLLDHGADPSDREALLDAAKAGYADVVALLARKANEETRTEAVRLASIGVRQTPGVFGAREATPENGHARTVELLRASAQIRSFATHWSPT